MRKVDSPNIVKLLGVYETSNSIYLVQEYAPGLTLQKLIKKQQEIPLVHRRNIMKGLMNALTCLEEVRIVHRDIKPENIVYNGSDESLKIVDFGLATYTNQPSYIYVRCGTPGHVAP
jgi:serine/threonine protein kinase